jgi:hypothetical protein
MSVDPKKFGLSKSLIDAVNEALHPNQKKLDVAEPKGKLDAKDFKKLRGEGSKPDFIDIDKDGNKSEPMKNASKEIKEDDAHFAQQSKKMQDAINMHLRKGKSYADAAKAAKVHVKEEADLEENKLYHVSWGSNRDHQVVAKHGEEAVSKAKAAILKKNPKLQDKKYSDAFDKKPTVTNLSHERKVQKEEALDEKAVSQAQQKAAGAALATQRGEYAGGKKGGAVNRMALMKASELRKIAATKRTGLPMRKEEIVSEADDAIAKQIATKKDAMQKQIRQKIAQKQMSVLQQKAQKKIQTIKAGTEKCSCGTTNESKMKCEVHGGNMNGSKGGKEAIVINPPLREASKTKY